MFCVCYDGLLQYIYTVLARYDSALGKHSQLMGNIVTVLITQTVYDTSS